MGRTSASMHCQSNVLIAMYTQAKLILGLLLGIGGELLFYYQL